MLYIVTAGIYVCRTARLDLRYLTVYSNNPNVIIGNVQSLGCAIPDAVYAEVIRPRGRHTERTEDIKGMNVKHRASCI